MSLSYTGFLHIVVGPAPTGAAMVPRRRQPGYGEFPATDPLNL
jgi:hypothetical protein